MKFTRELSATLTIRSVTPSGFKVNDHDYSSAIALTPHEVIDDWPQKAVQDLSDSDFAGLLDRSPELIILGTGACGEFPPRELMFSFARRGVGLEVMDSAAAARTFNVLAGEGRQVVAVLYV